VGLVYGLSIRDTDLFQFALGLSSPRMETRGDLYVDCLRGCRFACAQCGREGSAVHDLKDET
jgi:hypothetical protein